MWNNEEINDFIILQAMHLLQKQYPTITTQPSSLVFSTGYSYCPSEVTSKAVRNKMKTHDLQYLLKQTK